MKVTPYPPVGYLIEYAEGPIKDTKLMEFYIPKGNKTGVTVVGELQSSMMSDNQLKGAVQASLDKPFEEDQQNLKKM